MHCDNCQAQERIAADIDDHARKSAECIPRSLWVVLILLGISAFISYVDRANLSIAAPILKDELGLSASQLGVLQKLAGTNATGRWTALQNFAGNLAGVAAPALTGVVLDRTHHFVYAFAIMAVIAVTGAASWLFIVGPVREVSWSIKQL